MWICVMPCGRCFAILLAYDIFFSLFSVRPFFIAVALCSLSALVAFDITGAVSPTVSPSVSPMLDRVLFLEVSLGGCRHGFASDPILQS